MSKRYTQEEAEQIFNDKGYKCLEEYTDAQTPIKYLCSCGEECFGYLRCIKRGRTHHGCTDHKLKYSIDDATTIFKKVKLTLIGPFRTYRDQVECKCDICGYIFMSRLQSAMNGHGCKKCGDRCAGKKRKGKNHPFWISNRKEAAARERFRCRCYALLHGCLNRLNKPKEGHTYKLLGYSSIELKNYIENHPNWNSVKNSEWEIDHIFPVCAFVQYGINDLKLINCLDNLQPLF